METIVSDLNKANDSQLALIENSILMEKAKTSFAHFVVYTMPEFLLSWHNILLMQKLQELADGKIRRLMVFMPPRHGKSELVSRRFPAFMLGRNPDAKIIGASYGSDLASMMNRDVQRIIDSDPYRSIFPDTSLEGSHVKGGSEGRYVRNSSMFEIVNHSGYYKSAGVGGAITGVGAQCFQAHTKITAEFGSKLISEITVNEKVWSYNHETNSRELKRVEAILQRGVSRLVQIKTTGGRKVSCTPEHPIYTEERGYWQAAQVIGHTVVAERSPDGSCSSLPNLSRPSPQVTSDTVSMVETLCSEEVPVYDLQIEGNHNFFANGILVHNCAIIDDPIKNQAEASSSVFRQAVWDWYTSTLYTRLEEPRSILVTLTRWHEDDLAGRLLNQMKEDPKADKWEILNLPARCEVKTKHPLDPRSEGEPLWAENFNEETLNSIKSAVGSKVWDSLYQQRPTGETGNIVKRHWFKYYSAETLPKKFDECIQVWDLTFKEKVMNDFVVGTVWGRRGADVFLLDMIRERMDFPKTLIAFENMTTKWPQATAKIVEDKANGPALIATLKSKIRGIIPFNPQGSKEERLYAVTPQIESGNVYLPNKTIAPWIDTFSEEVIAFPNAPNDDCVDNLSMALLRFNNSSKRTLTNLLRF